MTLKKMLVNCSTGAAVLADMTPEEEAAHITAAQANALIEKQRENDLSALRQKIMNLVQSAVGVAVVDLTAAQQKALMAAALYKLGILDKNAVVRPLEEWL